MRKFIGLSFALSALGLAACGSDSTPAIDAAPGVDQAVATVDAPAAAVDAPAAAVDAADTPDAASAAMVTLTVKNYLSWCSVTIENGSPSSAASQTVMVPAGSVVHLNAVKLNDTFVFGYWFGTDGDTSAAHDTNMTTTATVMDANKTVQACCPFASAPTVPCGAP